MRYLTDISGFVGQLVLAPTEAGAPARLVAGTAIDGAAGWIGLEAANIEANYRRLFVDGISDTD